MLRANIKLLLNLTENYGGPEGSNKQKRKHNLKIRKHKLKNENANLKKKTVKRKVENANKKKKHK